MLEPGQKLEKTLKVINNAMNYASVPYWLCFGGLWGLIQNDGVVPDGDLDLCTYYGQDYRRIAKAFAATPGRYIMTKAIVSDTDKDMALYCGFNSEAGLPHLCLSFWYPHEGISYYCHDQAHEVKGVGVPASGYFFRGVPTYAIEKDDCFRLVEWPGIVQSIKIRVPRFPGVVLDHLYPDWAFRQQKYNIDRKHTVIRDKSVSYHKGGAISPYAVHVVSMNDFQNKKHIEQQLAEGRKKWEIRLKTGR